MSINWLNPFMPGDLSSGPMILTLKKHLNIFKGEMFVGLGYGQRFSFKYFPYNAHVRTVPPKYMFVAMQALMG